MEQDRSKVITKTSVIGIIGNMVLVLIKATIGVLSNSIAIILDAVNNLSDALSSVITIIGAKIARKAPDKKHPHGHGRVEYLSAMVISFIILYVGITSGISSVKNIINPETPDYSYITIIIIIAAVCVKIGLGLYFNKMGKKVNSDALVASGKDALFDAILSAGTLIATIAYLVFQIKIDGYIGAIISIFILKTGVEILIGTISKILGERVDRDLARDVKNTIQSFDEVKGVYDLIIHNYGPDSLIGSCHIEIRNDMTIDELDTLEREITTTVYLKHKLIIGGISIYSTNTQDLDAVKIKDSIVNITSTYPEILQLHGFYCDKKNNKIGFDIVIDFQADKEKLYKELSEKIKNMYPKYEVSIIFDSDITD